MDHKVKKQDEEYIVSRYNTTTAEVLSKEFGCSKERIAQVWSKFGLNGKDNRSYYFNFDYFESVDGVDKSYFLGFIAADGCVFQREGSQNRQALLSIVLSKKDEEILHKFNKYIEGNCKVSNRISTSDDGTNLEYCSLQMVSNKLCNDLEKYNITPRKTWTFSIANIPNDQYWHFLRGYFDGDGSIFNNGDLPSNYIVTVCGNKTTMTQIHDFLQAHGIKSSLIQDSRSYSDDFFNLTIHENKSKQLFLENLYKDCSDLYLRRKKEKADKFLNIQLDLNK